MSEKPPTSGTGGQEGENVILDFSNVQSWSELYHLIDNAGEITSSSGKAHTAHEVKEAIADNNLNLITRTGGLRQKIEELFDNQGPDFRIVSDFDHLFTMMRKHQVKDGKGRNVNVDEMINFIKSIRDTTEEITDDAPAFNMITRRGGLRATVIRLKREHEADRTQPPVSRSK